MNSLCLDSPQSSPSSSFKVIVIIITIEIDSFRGFSQTRRYCNANCLGNINCMLAPHPASKQLHSIACQSNIQKQLSFSLLTQTKLFLTAEILKYSLTFFSEVDKMFWPKTANCPWQVLAGCLLYTCNYLLKGAMLKRC